MCFLFGLLPWCSLTLVDGKNPLAFCRNPWLSCHSGATQQRVTAGRKQAGLPCPELNSSGEERPYASKWRSPGAGVALSGTVAPRGPGFQSPGNDEGMWVVVSIAVLPREWGCTFPWRKKEACFLILAPVASHFMVVLSRFSKHWVLQLVFEDVLSSHPFCVWIKI